MRSLLKRSMHERSLLHEKSLFHGGHEDEKLAP